MAKQTKMPTPEMPEWRDEAGRIDIAASREAGARVDAQIRLCWKNAALAGAALMSDVPQAGLTYHEGLAILPLNGGGYFPIEHGWLETAAGAVVDPTLPLTMPDEQLARVRYITAFVWPADEPGKMVFRRGTITLPLSGMGGGQFEDAFRAQAGERLRATWEHVVGLD